MISTRRELLLGLAAQATVLLAPSSSHADSAPFRASSPGPGTAGGIWLPLIDEALKSQGAVPPFKWVGGNPGQVQTQLLTGAVDVSVFGPLGLAQARAQGHDIVIFGPALNNHGRWIVRGDSPYKTPHDLVGKRIATQPETSETFKQAALAAAAHGIDLKSQTKLIFGPPIVNLALFNRGDVDAVIELEPLATKLVGQGARQIATVSGMWQEAVGGEALFLVGLAAYRSWLEANRESAEQLAQLYLRINRQLVAQPGLFRRYHDSLSIGNADTGAIDLLEARMPEVYATKWNPSVWSSIDRLASRATQLGLAPAAAAGSLYDTKFLKDS